MTKNNLTQEELARNEIIAELTNKMSSTKDAVLQEASRLDKTIISIQSLHGLIGGKNNTYIDGVSDSFPTAKHYIDSWLDGLYKFVMDQSTYGKNPKENRTIRYLKNPLIKEYIFLFLERTFYTHYNERVREKPDDSLWEVWFGNKLSHGLIIALSPIGNNSYRIDHSEIRRAKYEYWTIGHIMAVGGLWDGNTNSLYKLNSVEEILQYYEHTVKALSQSEYEKQICDLYIEYIRDSDKPEGEPFLIPEFRYGGNSVKHEYRLDFTILNPYTFDFIGFELSPASSHMSVFKKNEKTQKQINQEQKEKWEKEMDKRNEYFKKFGITVITFTDSKLKSINDCFDTIKKYLSDRTPTYTSAETTMQKIQNL